MTLNNYRKHCLVERTRRFYQAIFTTKIQGVRTTDVITVEAMYYFEYQMRKKKHSVRKNSSHASDRGRSQLRVAGGGIGATRLRGTREQWNAAAAAVTVGSAGGWGGDRLRRVIPARWARGFFDP